ncbi:GntR family transcriptional regulator [Nonomuraea fuscirosea]|uniref:GntR family transcriptional regulator n=1 Tax=Nonomuraea fuscirosea TaxID=1291556 RepID=UPI00342482A7
MPSASTRPPSQPLYLRVADDLRDFIRRGLPRKGKSAGQLDGEHELARQYDCSVGTIRAALKVLQDEGLITRTPGRTGTRVIMPVDPGVKRVRRGQERLQGRRDDSGLHQFMTFDVPQGKIKVINFKSGIRLAGVNEPVLMGCFGSIRNLIYRERTYTTEVGERLYSATNFLPLHLFSDKGESVLAQDTGEGGVWARLADAGHKVGEAVEYIDTRMPTEQERRDLQIDLEIPVFVVYRVAEDNRHRVVDLAMIVLPGDRWRLHYVVQKRSFLLRKKSQLRLVRMRSTPTAAT